MIKPKKYRARVLMEFIPDGKGEYTPQYEEVEGYLAPVSIQESYKVGEEPKTEIIWGLYLDVPYFEKCVCMGGGMTIYSPKVYTEFTDLEEIDDE